MSINHRGPVLPNSTGRTIGEVVDWLNANTEDDWRCHAREGEAYPDCADEDSRETWLRAGGWWVGVFRHGETDHVERDDIIFGSFEVQSDTAERTKTAISQAFTAFREQYGSRGSTPLYLAIVRNGVDTIVFSFPTPRQRDTIADWLAEALGMQASCHDVLEPDTAASATQWAREHFG